jgi:hypothetical protein
MAKRMELSVLCLVLAFSALAAEEPAYTMRGYDPRLQEGIDLIYNLRFAEAEQHFQQIVQADPANPMGYFFLAMVSWWQVLVDLDSIEHDQAFYARLDECIQACDRKLEQDPMDFDAILFKGGAIGFRGRLRGDRGEYLSAAADGIKCLPLLQKSRQLEPTNKDILFGQGIYNYFAEVIPQKYSIVRPVTALLPEGNRAQGLQQLEEVAQEGKYARAEAAYFLAQIYRMFEENKPSALAYLEYLHTRYPPNAVFHRNRARTLADLGRWEQATPLFQEYILRSQEGWTGYHVHGRLEALYYLGKYALAGRRLEEAEKTFLEIDDLGRGMKRESDQGYVALANLLLGITYDLQDQRDLAVARYQRVKKLPDWGSSRELADQYLKEPYRTPP